MITRIKNSSDFIIVLTELSPEVTAFSHNASFTSFLLKFSAISENDTEWKYCPR